MPKSVVRTLLQGQSDVPQQAASRAFAPINIALIKYWGKRDEALNLPCTDSVSVTLPDWGTTTSLEVSEGRSLVLGGRHLPEDHPVSLRLWSFLDLFPGVPPLCIRTEGNIPMEAGLASSASGYAALVGALSRLYGWTLPLEHLSILARFGSGSACRSFWPGFVQWRAGTRPDGMDSHGVPLPDQMPGLRVGLLILDGGSKGVSSREAMRVSRHTSPYFPDWPSWVARDQAVLREALRTQDFNAFGRALEGNALAMHLLIQTSVPALSYTKPKTVQAVLRIHQLRAEGLPIYWTQDAGPNLKVLFQKKDEAVVRETFPEIMLSDPHRVSSSFIRCSVF